MCMIRHMTGQWEINGHSTISLPPGHRVTWNENLKTVKVSLSDLDLQMRHMIAA